MKHKLINILTYCVSAYTHLDSQFHNIGLTPQHYFFKGEVNYQVCQAKNV